MNYHTTACTYYVIQEFPFLEVPQTCGIYRATLVRFTCVMWALRAIFSSPYVELAGGWLVVGVGVACRDNK